MPNSQHGGFGEVMLFFLDGKILIEARGKAGREIIQLWDVDTGHDLGALYGHTWRIQTLLVFLKSTQNPLSINDLSIRGYENAKKCSLIDPYYVKKTPCFQYKIK